MARGPAGEQGDQARWTREQPRVVLHEQPVGRRVQELFRLVLGQELEGPALHPGVLLHEEEVVLDQLLALELQIDREVLLGRRDEGPSPEVVDAAVEPKESLPGPEKPANEAVFR